MIRHKISLFAFLALLGFSACTIDEVPNPNGASLEDILDNASRSDLQALVSGMESLLGKEIGFYYDVTSIIGREYYFFTSADPRYTGELLGKGDSQLDNAGFYGTRPFAGRYKTVKNANILIEAVQNNAEDLSLSEQEINGYLGFAKTIQAYELHLVLNLQYQNGIRLDVSDPDNLGAFVTYQEGLTGLLNLLDEAYTHLQNAGDEFPFVLGPGFEGFDTPETFGQFNRALTARLTIYQGPGQRNKALEALRESFLDFDGPLDEGPLRYYSTAGGEETNPLFRVPNQSEAIVAHPDFVADLASGDDRANKIERRDAPISLDNLTGAFDVLVFSSLSDPIPLINNEELILLYAEANVGIDNGEAVRAINIIRTAHGLAPYSGPTTEMALIDEILTQRRYSLFGLGHRWIDLRRFDRLDELPIDRPGDDVWEQLPRPVTEI